MKNVFLINCCIFFVVIFSSLAYPQQEPEHEKIVEKVTVINVEVPVRVFYKGEPVTDLTKDDFIIFEGKKKVKIHGFFLKRKRINITGTKEVIIKDKPAPLPMRTFVVVFRITDFNDHIVKAVEHLFENVLRKKDRLLVFANNKTMSYPHLEKKEKIQRQLLNNLKEESKQARRRLVRYINKIETYLNVHDFRRQLFQQQDNPEDRLLDFLKKYLLTWNQYKQNYLTPDLDHFYFFAKYLEEIKSEKWVLNFYQFDLFPNIRLGSRTMQKLRDISTRLIRSTDPVEYAMGKAIHRILNQLVIDLNAGSGVPVNEVAKLFYKVDATFHSFLIRSTNSAALNDLEYREVASDIEQTLREITKITGGETITSNNLVKSIKTVSQKEDVYYMLTYVPLKTGGKAGRIKVKLRNKKKKYKIFYDNNFRANYIARYLEKLENKIQTPEIKIKSFSFDKKILSFTVTDYRVRAVGRMKVRIRLTDSANKPLFDQLRTLTAQKTELKIALGTFKKIKKGDYHFLIDATDLLTGKEANFHTDITVKR